MKDELKINVEVVGKTASGKSTVIYLMKEFLREKGFLVRFDGGVDYDNEFLFDQSMNSLFSDADLMNRKVKAISEKSKIVINEVQAKIG